MSGESGKSGKIYCANCIHCKLLKASTDDGLTLQMVRCAAGHWKKQLGEEKLYKYRTIDRRKVASCKDYDEMGDTRPFIKELKRNLPTKDDSFHVD